MAVILERSETYVGRKLVTKTRSICPECNRILEADVVEEDGKIKIYKTCPKHGEFDDLYFGDAEMYYRFARWLHDGKGTGNPNVEMPRCACPANCGLCSSHLSHTGLSNLVVTNRCDLHCWYCLPGDEEIIVRDAEGVRLVKAGELVDGFFRDGEPEPAGEGESVKVDGVEVLSFRNGQAAWSKLRRAYRRRYSGKIVEIITRTGRSVKVTADHMVIVLTEKGYERRRACNLRKGDKLLTLWSFDAGGSKPKAQLNLLKDFTTLPVDLQKKTYVRGFAGKLDERSVTAPPDKVYRWFYRDSIPLAAIQAVAGRLENVSVGLDATDIQMPDVLNLTEDLMELVGYFISDGHYTYKDVRITVGDEYVYKRLQQIVDGLGLRASVLRFDKHSKTPQLVIGSRLLKTVFEHVFEIPAGAPNKRLPPFSHGLPKHLKTALLTGLVNGDGYVVRGRKNCSIGYATTSKGLARDIVLLLASLGIFSRVYRVPKHKMKGAKHDLYKIYVAGKDLEKLVALTKLKPSHLSKLAGLGPRKEAKVRRLGDFAVDEVADVVEQHVEHEHVYDIEVEEESHTFICGGGILVSNCFFYAEKAGYIYEPTLEQIREMVKQLKAERPVPGNSVQITGGEPCLRDDLPEIIRILKEEGVDHVQLNTNGIRLAHDFEFFKRVKEAGVSNLYMSFDGVTPRTNPKNHWEVPKTLENARKLGVGVVLVPTVIKSVNDHELGDIIRFGFQNIDVVRAVNFQPVSLTGRMPKKEREKYRITIPDCIIRIEEQTNGEIPRDAWFPVPACTPLTNFIEAITRRAQYELSIHFACGAGTYVFKDHDKLIPITAFVDIEGLIKTLQDKTEEIQAGKNPYYVALKLLANISKHINTNKQPTGLNLKHLLYNIIIKHNYHTVGDWHRRSLFLGMMHFMDCYNHDEERLRRCDIHYLTPDMRIIPFCAFNVLPHWYRDRIQAMYGMPIAEWERK
ncbi:MAG: radical SAM protein, partial [Candidatus Caldarchaeum sp.]